MMGWKVPVNAAQVAALNLTDILHISAFLIPLALLSVVIGLIWNKREWLINASIWYGVFTVFYTSMFTNGAGFFTGMVGSLGYWLEQQGVQRGNQPWYYYAAVQMPVYEYLPAIGTLLALGLLIYEAGQAPDLNARERPGKRENFLWLPRQTSTAAGCQRAASPSIPQTWIMRTA